MRRFALAGRHIFEKECGGREPWVRVGVAPTVAPKYGWRGSREAGVSTTGIIVIVIAAVVVLALLGTAVAFFGRERERRALQKRFGPEYAHTVDATGDTRQAEANLRDRLQQREGLSIKSLSPAERDRYQQEWRQVQAAFVDAPATALGQGDSLITRVMTTRGYPVQDFEEQADLVSVDHPSVVEHYRKAHGIYVDSLTRPVSTDEMREALVSLRSLFSELVEDDRSEAGTTASPAGHRSST